MASKNVASRQQRPTRRPRGRPEKEMRFGLSPERTRRSSAFLVRSARIGFLASRIRMAQVARRAEVHPVESVRPALSCRRQRPGVAMKFLDMPLIAFPASRSEAGADPVQECPYFLANGLHSRFVDQFQDGLGIHERDRYGSIHFFTHDHIAR
jgi:hypothetical protein